MDTALLKAAAALRIFHLPLLFFAVNAQSCMLMLVLDQYSWLPIDQLSSRDFISHRTSSHCFNHWSLVLVDKNKQITFLSQLMLIVPLVEVTFQTLNPGLALISIYLHHQRHKSSQHETVPFKSALAKEKPIRNSIGLAF
jgi:hypothetical protein